MPRILPATLVFVLGSCAVPRERLVAELPPEEALWWSTVTSGGRDAVIVERRGQELWLSAGGTTRGPFS